MLRNTQSGCFFLGRTLQENPALNVRGPGARIHGAIADVFIEQLMLLVVVNYSLAMHDAMHTYESHACNG